MRRIKILFILFKYNEGNIMHLLNLVPRYSRTDMDISLIYHHHLIAFIYGFGMEIFWLYHVSSCETEAVVQTNLCLP